MNDGVIMADTIDTWQPMSEEPQENGWYDVKISKHNLQTTEEIVGLALFRDGEWSEASTPMQNVLAWTEPLKIKDDIDHPAGFNGEAQINLAQRILEDASAEFMDAYRDLLTAQHYKGYSDRIQRYRSINRFMSDVRIETLSMGATQENICKTLCGKVLAEYGVCPENNDETRRSIHDAIRKWIRDVNEKSKYADPEDIEGIRYYAGVVARDRIRAAAGWGTERH